MGPVDALNEQRYGLVPFTTDEAAELREIGKLRHGIGNDEHEKGQKTDDETATTTVAVLVPSWRHHPAAFAVLRASLTMAGVPNTVAHVSDPIWAALFNHAAAKDSRSYGKFTKKDGEVVRRSVKDELQQRRNRRQYFSRALDFAHDAISEAAEQLVMNVAATTPSVDNPRIRIMLLADGDAGWVCRSFLRARGKSATYPTQHRGIARSRPLPAVETEQAGTDAEPQADLHADVRVDVQAPPADTADDATADVPHHKGSVRSRFRGIAGAVAHFFKRGGTAKAEDEAGRDRKADGKANAEDAAEEQPLSELGLQDLLEEISARSKEMSVAREAQSQRGQTEDATDRKAAQASTVPPRKVDFGAFVSVGRFQSGSAAAQMAYLLSADMGRERGLKREDAPQAIDASRGLFQGAALAAPSGVYVLELQGAGVTLPEEGEADGEASSDAVTAEEIASEVSAKLEREGPRVLLSCLNADGVNVGDLCFVNFNQRARRDRDGNAESRPASVFSRSAGSDSPRVLISQHERSNVLRGYEVFAEPRAVAKWLRRVLSNMQ